MPVRLGIVPVVVLLAAASLGASGLDSPLVAAAERRDATAVAALLKQGADANATQPDGSTALHWAAHWSDLTLAKTLTKAGANANAANEYGVTPLFLAAENGNPELMDVLVAAGANPRAALPSGETVLMTAVRGGSLAAITRLLAAGADPNLAQSSKQQTALMWAATAQRVDIARLLIAKGANVSARTAAGFTPLLFAAREGGIEMARLLLELGANVNERATDGSTPVLVATVRGHAPLATFLLGQGGNANGDPKTVGYGPLHWAVARFEDQTRPVNPDVPGEWKVLFGLPDRQEKLVLIRALISHGADVNAKTTQPLPQSHFCLSPCRGVGFTGTTPFIIAAGSGDGEVMKILLEHGADPNIRADSGATAIITASIGNAPNSVSAGSSVIVTQEDRVAAIKVAIDAGVNIEAEDELGYRAIHVAAASGYHDIIKLLLASGAEMNPLTKPGEAGVGERQSPLGIVEGTYVGGTVHERPETATFLRGLGAKSVGKVTLERFLKPAEEQKKPESRATGAR